MQTAVGLQMIHQLCGAGAVFLYSSSFFSGDARIWNTLVGGINVVAACFTVFLMDRVGRRPVSTSFSHVYATIMFLFHPCDTAIAMTICVFFVF